MERGKRIAFDYGDVRIGVAVSDQEAILAAPLTRLRTKLLPCNVNYPNYFMTLLRSMYI